MTQASLMAVAVGLGLCRNARPRDPLQRPQFDPEYARLARLRQISLAVRPILRYRGMIEYRFGSVALHACSFGSSSRVHHDPLRQFDRASAFGRARTLPPER